MIIAEKLALSQQVINRYRAMLFLLSSQSGSGMRYVHIIIGATIVLAACSRQPAGQPVPAGNSAGPAFQLPPDPFGWPIVDASDRRVGTVFTKLNPAGQVLISLDISGLPAGVHGVNVHEYGRCDGPKFQSAGAHWNWTKKKHGHGNPEGAHAGDLGNLTVGSDGNGQATFTVQSKDWDQKARFPMSIVIHASEDDDRTDPSGNSGDRIACGKLYLRRD